MSQLGLASHAVARRAAPLDLETCRVHSRMQQSCVDIPRILCKGLSHDVLSSFNERRTVVQAVQCRF